MVASLVHVVDDDAAMRDSLAFLLGTAGVAAALMIVPASLAAMRSGLPAWLGWLVPGSPFRFRIDETGRSYEAKVTRLGAAVDPVSQTVRGVGQFAGGREAVLPGMSGSAEFAQNPASRQRAQATP